MQDASQVPNLGLRVPNPRNTLYIYIYICTFRVYVSIFGFSGLNSENSLFYSVLRRPATSEMAHHKPTKSFFTVFAVGSCKVPRK